MSKVHTLADLTKEQKLNIGIRESPVESENDELKRIILNGSPPPPNSPGAPIEGSSRNSELFELPEPPMSVQDLIEDLKLVNTHVARKGISKSYLDAFDKQYGFILLFPTYLNNLEVTEQLFLLYQEILKRNLQSHIFDEFIKKKDEDLSKMISNLLLKRPARDSREVREELQNVYEILINPNIHSLLKEGFLEAFDKSNINALDFEDQGMDEMTMICNYVYENELQSTKCQEYNEKLASKRVLFDRFGGYKGRRGNKTRRKNKTIIINENIRNIRRSKQPKGNKSVKKSRKKYNKSKK